MAIHSFGVLLFTIAATAQPTFADCTVLGKQGSELEPKLSAAMDDYLRFVSSLSKTTLTPETFPKALLVINSLLDAYNQKIRILELGEAERCFGEQAASWKQVLENLRAKRTEFINERDLLLKYASTFTASKQGTIPKAEWKPYLTPYLKAFVTCVVQTKRRALAMNSKKPSPNDFALIMRGACNSEAAIIDTKQNDIEGFTQDDRRDIRQSVESARAKAISEYTEAFHGLR